MEMDFSGQPPQAKTLEEAQGIINVLWLAVLELRAENVALKKRVTELEEKLNTNSRNSSTPPSQNTPGLKGTSSNQGTSKNKKHKQGGQPGHKGKGRELLPIEEVDHVKVCAPAKQCGCGGLIHPTGNFRRHQVHEVPRVTAIVTEYQLHYGTCYACQRVHEAPLPTGIPTGMLGPMAMSAVSTLTGYYHLSKRETVGLLSDFFNLEVSVGTIANTEQSVSMALSAPVEEAKLAIKDEPQVHCDETGHKEQGKQHWAWVATTLFLSVFLIRASRGTIVAKELLGEFFAGILISDRWSAYAWVAAAMRQLCWAHLLRDFQKISEREGQSQRLGLLLLAYGKKMFMYWHRFREQKFTRQRFQELVWPVRVRIESLLEQGACCGNSKTEQTCKRILKLKDALWIFVEKENVEPTNNLAERVIRPLVIWRKKNFGTQSKDGSQYLERVMTVSTSCRLQHRNVLDFIAQAVQAHLANTKPPSLLPNHKLLNSYNLKIAA